MEKKEYEELYVASRVYHYQDEIEPMMQYDTLGKIDHLIKISKSKVLVYSKTDEKGNKEYYLYPSNAPVIISPFTHSFSTVGTYDYKGRLTDKDIKSHYKQDKANEELIDKMYPSERKEITDEGIRYYDVEYRYVDGLIPVSKFFKTEHNLTPKLAHVLLKVMNHSIKKEYITLSFDKKIAIKQLKELWQIPQNINQEEETKKSPKR